MKITRVQARWLRVPLAPEQQHRSDFGRQATFDTTLVSVETEAGHVGWGEAKAAVGSSATCAALVACIEQELAPLVVGRDARRIRHIWELMYNGPRAELSLTHGRVMPVLGRRGVRVAAMSGLDMALWDLLGRSLEVPIVQLLGGPCRAEMPAYASGGWSDADGIGAELGRYVEAGFDAVKMRVGALDPDVDTSIRRVHAAREALPAHVALMCDAHGTMRPPDAKRFCRAVEDRGLAWLEEPCSGDDLAGTAAVRAATSIPIALGESLFTRFDVRDAIAANAVDVVQPDAAIVGGLTEMTRVAALCETHQLELAPHLWGSALSFMAGLHVAFASPSARVLEYSLGANPMLRELVDDPPTPVGGRLAAPTGPGLGVTPRAEFIEAYAIAGRAGT